MKNITTRIAEIACKLNPVELVTYQNEREEGEKFKKAFLGKEHLSDPKFTYDFEKLKAVMGWKATLQVLIIGLREKISDYPVIKSNSIAKIDAVERIILRRMDELMTTCELASAMLAERNDVAGDMVRAKYGIPSSEAVQRAYRVANGQEMVPVLPGAGLKEISFTHEKYDAEQIKKAFENVLAEYGIDGWQVVIDEHTNSIDVRDKNFSGIPTVVIPKDRVVSGPKLCELIGHEIECHLRDSENSRAFWQSILTDEYLPLVPILAKSDDELLYEGHAKISDVEVLGSKSLPSPYYIMVIDQALRGMSFSKTFFALLSARMASGMSDEKAVNRAWIDTRRIFRGCVDTENQDGYANPKDRAYFEGYMVARDNERILDFASMTLQDIKELTEAGFDLTPTYRDKRLCIRPGLIGLA